VRILFGTGNPGRKYSLTRHNAGFLLLDYFAQIHSLKFKPSKFDFYSAEGELNNSTFLLIEPTTFVNQSGIAADQVIKNFNSTLNEFLVIHDDIALPLGTLKVKMAGGDGGHNGLSSIIYHLNSDQFPRLRIGIGNNFSLGQMPDYVLSKFKRTERKVLAESFESGKFLLEEFITGGIKKMLDTNSRISKAETEKKIFQ
jgi:PTH1 family peptidyl-tRNA hydrolase